MVIDELIVYLQPGRRVDLWAEVARFLEIPTARVLDWRILRRSVDARKKSQVRILYRLEVVIADKPGTERARAAPDSAKSLSPKAPEARGTRRIGRTPVVVGTGPAGLFAALALCEKGYRPLILERGEGMARRVEKVGRFWREGVLDPASNVQFGEGGAGTFSDGKLTSRSKHPLVERVFETFHRFGAPEEILYEQKPHLGTEKVRAIVCRIRNRIVELGGTFHYGTLMERLVLRDRTVVGVEAGGHRIDTDAVFLATGHSARDTYHMLYSLGVAMEAKAFAVGFRIEHRQSLIDRAQYGSFAGHAELGAADYRLTWQDRTSGRGIYSFCNCPGGVIVAAASEHGGVVTNGMSRYARATGLSNSAIVVSVSPRDFGREGPLGGIFFQQRMERGAYELGGGQYLAPAQRTRDFLARRPSAGELRSSYQPGIVPGDIGRLLPENLVGPLRQALRNFGAKIRGFEDSVLVAPETRTSAPVRIARNKETLESVNTPGLFPVGEGSGYTGGIVSSAIDGLKAVLNVTPGP